MPLLKYAKHRIKDILQKLKINELNYFRAKHTIHPYLHQF